MLINAAAAAAVVVVAAAADAADAAVDAAGAVAAVLYAAGMRPGVVAVQKRQQPKVRWRQVDSMAFVASAAQVEWLWDHQLNQQACWKECLM